LLQAIQQCFYCRIFKKTMLETQQEIWKLNTDLEMATNEKMQELLGNANYSYSLSDIGSVSHVGFSVSKNSERAISGRRL